MPAKNLPPTCRFARGGGRILGGQLDAGTPTITNEDVAITFAIPVGQAAWQATGCRLSAAYGTSRQPVTSDYHMSRSPGVPARPVHRDDLRHLRTAGQLDNALRRMWGSRPDRGPASSAATT